MTTELRYLAASIILRDSPRIFIQRHDAFTWWGVRLYFWGRVLLAAAAGFGLVRSMIFWNTALSGIVLFLIALMRYRTFLSAAAC